jgi:GTPase
MIGIKKIALVGRPNVGKSALFNAICKRKAAIVDELEGVTRDRLYSRADFFGYPFEIIDTGGLVVHSDHDFIKEIRRQTDQAISEADAIILVVDGKVGPQVLDEEVAKLLHKTKKPLTLAVNKIDSRDGCDMLCDFFHLGIPSIIGVSATHSFHIVELLEKALAPFDKTIKPENDTPIFAKVAICGRPNVGKSTLFNTLCGTERALVSPIAGTTRDAIDMKVEKDGEQFLFIDTAGIRRRSKEKEVVGRSALLRTELAIERSDVSLLVIDAMQGMTGEEKKIARMIEKYEKGAALLFNKWDLNKGFRMEHCIQALEKEIPYFHHVPKLFLSAKTGRNVDKIFPIIREVASSYERRISTHKLNKSLIDAIQKNHPPAIGSKRLRIYYLTQIGVRPPHFVLFINSKELFDSSYKKYLINHLREDFGFTGVPLILHLREKEEKKERHQAPSSSIDRDIAPLEALVEEDYSSPNFPISSSNDII